MRVITFILALIPFVLLGQGESVHPIIPKGHTAQYDPWTKGKMWGYFVVMVGGFADGAVEGYEFDGRRSFERKWGINEDHPFWGSRSWKTGKNTGWEKNFGVIDFYHTADDLRKWGYISGGIVVGLNGKKVNTKKIHYVYDAIISIGLSAMSKWAGMYYIRHIDGF